MAAGPTMSQMAQTTGATQQATVKTVAPKITKESEQARHGILGEEEEGDGKTKGAGKGTGGPAGTGQAQFGDQDKAKVKRRKVKLSTLAQRDVAGKEEAGETKDTGKAAKAKAQAQTGNAKDLGYKKAAGVLMQNSRVVQSSIKYEAACRARDTDPNNALSPKGQQRWMLNNLIKITSDCCEQHTGGKAGEAYPSRRDQRLIKMALCGLRDGNQKTESASSSSDSKKPMSKAEYQFAQAKAMTIVNHIIDPPVRPEHMPEYSEVA